MSRYFVDVFLPSAPSGCGSNQDEGWTKQRCTEFTEFLNYYAENGYRLHSAEYRSVAVNTGCGSNTGSWLVCIFEKEKSNEVPSFRV